MPEAPIKILIVDDHAFVRQGLRDFIEREKDLIICGEAAGRADALTLCEKVSPDFALVDLSLGKDSGIDLVKDISIRFPQIKMIVLSMQDEILYAERVLRAGAAGYVSKDSDPAQLIEALRCVMAGGIYASEAVKQKIMQIVRKTTLTGDPVSHLSDRELAVFEKIGRGLSTGEIAESMSLSIKTIETYRARIKSKLGVSSASELVQRAVQRVMDKNI